VSISGSSEPCDFEAGDRLDPDGMGLTRYPNEIQPERALAACRAAVAENPDVGRYHYQLGRALTALRRFDEAQASYETARDLGHARAYYALGSAVLNAERQSGGRFESAAPEEALRLFALGVEAGDPYAFHSLGRQFMRHGGREEVELEGYDLLMRALEVGHTFAMNELGFFYLDEDGQYYDPARGLRYLRESAARGDIYGFNNMGLVHLRGLGGEPVDAALAYDFFRRAAEGGHPTAPANLARIYREGLVDGRPDMERAVHWYLEGLERGDALAGGNGAFLIASERPAGYALHDAAVVAAKAAALENQPAAPRAREFLASLPREAIDAGAQSLISTLGAPIGIDGAFGASSQAAMDTVLASRGAGPAETDPLERILQLAGLYWATSPFRVDLY
jgi:TPR repeat protein